MSSEQLKGKDKNYLRNIIWQVTYRLNFILMCCEENRNINFLSFKNIIMSTYKQIIYQIIFGTKKHKMTINDEHCEELYKYIWGIIKNKNCKLFRINGVENHIHILSDLHPSLGLAEYVKEIKVAGSIWLKESGKFPKFDGWQDGYAAFTYSIKEKDILIEYIKNQKQHHKRESFRDEYVRLLRENGVDFDEKYLI